MRENDGRLALYMSCIMYGKPSRLKNSDNGKDSYYWGGGRGTNLFSRMSNSTWKVLLGRGVDDEA